jgi:hypothetical protein
VLLRDYGSTMNFHWDDLVIGSIIAARGVSRYKERSRDPERSRALLPGLLRLRASKCSFIKNNEGRLPTGVGGLNN